MKQVRKSYSKTEKEELQKPVAGKTYYRFKKTNYDSRYNKAISYLSELEESEIRMMIHSSQKVAAMD